MPDPETERRLAELSRDVAVLNERQRATTDNMVEWQKRQDKRAEDMYEALKVVVEQTAESRGSIRTRKALVAGAVVFAGLLLTVIGIALQALGVFG